jgi:hypothetical protein
MLSIKPPGGNGTTSLMGRAGQACAKAGAAEMAARKGVATTAAKADTQNLRCMTKLLKN